MADLTVHDHYRTMTRQELAAELHRLASELESQGQLPYTTGTITVPGRVKREFVIEENTGGAMCKFEYRLRWPVDDE
jgi:hypothetical protein